ncbi:hypothetical protein HPULCUR_012070 [Helicostylum pulchrum]|uniref:Pyrrolo-quinoline quinone repeat domain-containing protein n=1 Tax=Helicostylum pulchrum TaxID=562976 RepID=A0ABP9YI50_9FUNG
MYIQPTNALFSIDKPFHSNELLICATKGCVFALRKTNGYIVWKLKIGSSTCIISLFITGDDTIIAGTLNKTFSIDLITGKTNWINVLPGVEYEEITVLAIPGPQLQYQSFNTEGYELDLPPNYDEPSERQHTPYILACSKGSVTAIHPKTGTTEWTFHTPITAKQLPTVIIDPPTKHANKPIVFIGISSTIYSLDAETGKLNWTATLFGTLFGSKYITLASSWSSKLAVETHTSFNQNPVLRQLTRNPPIY